MTTEEQLEEVKHALKGVNKWLTELQDANSIDPADDNLMQCRFALRDAFVALENAERARKQIAEFIYGEDTDGEP